MEFAGEDIEIKEEPISTDPYQPPEIEQIYIKEENVILETPEDNDAHDPLKLEEDILETPEDNDAHDPLKLEEDILETPEDNDAHDPLKLEEDILETPEDNDAHDPLKLEEDEFVSEEETGSPPDAIHIKKEPEVQIEAEPTSCDSEPERQGSNPKVDQPPRLFRKIEKR
ncbi:pharyngeal muscle protein 2-like isoform X3 [Schistocerca nitens]|uniref:pharyngeal muscle protein 2-like isoform X3 n=1 Tax=Schistocerca nitens TaxID=7011 RepID=UPI0021194867|nr:pharyngeal muscle protein 2-like isoform X3 [Schistocerca nitens]